MEEDREEQKRIRWESIKESRYNKWYGEIKGEGFPKYLLKGENLDGKGWPDLDWGMR